MNEDSICVSRLTQERKAWRRDHPFGFYAKPATENGQLNLKKWHCGIPGKKGTLWQGGLFKLTMTFPNGYPQEPPLCTFTPTIFHPNIYTDGDVCLSILNPEKGWKAAITVKQILVGIQELLSEPNINDPAQAPAFVLFRDDLAAYEDRVQLEVLKHPMS